MSARCLWGSLASRNPRASSVSRLRGGPLVGQCTSPYRRTGAVQLLWSMTGSSAADISTADLTLLPCAASRGVYFAANKSDRDESRAAMKRPLPYRLEGV